MLTNNVVNHDFFSARSQNIIEILGVKKVGENIVYNYSTPQSALVAWLDSPTHKGCIEGDYTHFGISIRLNAESKKYHTNIFIKIWGNWFDVQVAQNTSIRIYKKLTQILIYFDCTNF